MLKLGIIVSLLFLGGCAAGMSNLIEDAQQSGDWSLVEKRENALARFNQQFASMCPLGTQTVCVQSLSRRECQCLNRDRTREKLGYMLQ